MKKIMFSGRSLVSSLAICLLFVCSMAAEARNSKSFVYNKSDEMEIVSLYDSISGLITPYLKYEFSTSENGLSKTKLAYRWNETNRTWTPYYQFTATTVDGNQIQEYAQWNSRKKDFSLNKQKAIYYQVAGKDFTDYFSFKWNDKTGKWEVIDGAKFENYIKLLVSDNN
ncbi:MAG: hypothetical protein H6Q12_427 [Bacteroidetes bacterium]|nr:hypothetical protein [Bacteroidota bacterium]